MTRTTWVCLVAYGCILATLLYRMIGRIRVMALHLGVMNGGGDMVNRACDCVCGVMVKVRCPDRPGGDICAQLYMSTFEYVQIMSYDVGECNIDVVIDFGKVEGGLSLWLCCYFYDVLVYFWDNGYDIITTTTCCLTSTSDSALYTASSSASALALHQASIASAAAAFSSAICCSSATLHSISAMASAIYLALLVKYLHTLPSLFRICTDHS